MLLSLNYDPPLPLHVDPMDEAVAALVIVRENISKAFYNFFGRNTTERPEGELYRKVAGCSNITKPQFSFARRSSSQMSFDEGCSKLKCKVLYALGDLADNHSQVSPTDVNAGHHLCAKLDDADLSWDGEWE